MTPDLFEDLARYYDPLMTHVNYDRWFTITLALGELVEAPPRHLDAACGTGTLGGMLRQAGWDSTGIDLSPAMVREGRKKNPAHPLAVGDLRALPFSASFDIATCLFDSLNFLLDEDDFAHALRELYSTLRDGGLLYADIITERMVIDHFEGQDWVEANDGFQSRWTSSYDKQSGIAESIVQVNTGSPAAIRERVYALDEVRSMFQNAGFELLGSYDADTWKTPRKKSTRIEFVAVKQGNPAIPRRFEKMARHIRDMVYGG